MLRRPVACLVVSGLSVALLASTPAPASAVTMQTTVLDFDGYSAAAGRTTSGASVRIAHQGPDAVTAATRTASGGTVASVADGQGGRAVRLPAFGSAARGVVGVTAAPPRGTAHPLDPGTDDFRFGARFALDARSSGGPQDNGDNLVQRGLWGDPGQYKIQVDRKRLSCRVAGTRGEVFVVSPATIEPGRWYTARCVRHADTVTLSVASSGATTVETTRTGRIGAVSSPATTPLAVGGKMTRAGKAVLGDSDQLNGMIDDVVVSIARR